MSEAAGAPERGRSGTSPAHKIVQAALTILLLYLIFGVFLPNAIDYDAVVDALQEVDAAEVVLLVLFFLLIEGLKALEPALAIPALTYPQAVVSAEASTAISNVVPGPSGTATRFYIYRTWGLTSADFARGWLLTSLVNNGVILVMPAIALAAYATQGNLDRGVVILALIGLVVSIVGLVIVVLAARSEGFARRLGHIGGRLVTWARGIARRPGPKDFAEAAVGFRRETLDVLHRTGFKLVAVIVVKYFATAACLLVSLRAVGVPHDPLTVVGVFAAYSVVRLATVIEITPGGVGVVEVAYIAALTFVAGEGWDAQITAGVLLFRFVTYVAPIPVGAVCYVIWRRKTSWRREPSTAEEATPLAVVSALVDERIPPPAAG